MKIAVNNVDLIRELNLLEKIVGKKPTIPVLANVLIQTADMGTLVLSATDLEIGLVGACPADVLESGSATLPARKLTELVRAQSDDKIMLESGPRGAVIFTSGKFKSRLQALPSEDFPKIPLVEGHPAIKLPRALKRMIAQVRYAISDKEGRHFMKGALLSFREGQGLLMAATEGARLSVTEIPFGSEGWEPVLLPAKALDELFALLAEEGTGDITFARSDRHLFFELDGRLFISRQIEGKFPDYERIIPTQNEHRMVIERAAFASMLRRFVLIDEVVVLQLKENSLELSAASAEVGDGVEAVTALYEGPEIELRYKAQFLLDFLTTALSDTVTMDIKDIHTPVLFTDGNFFNVIMGMRM